LRERLKNAVSEEKLRMKRHEDLEYKAFQLVRESGTKGILQSLLWKNLNATSREGSRISARLEKLGLVRRSRELHGGKWTYRLIAKRRTMKVDSVMDIPCVFCVEQGKCGVGVGFLPLERRTKL